MTTSVIGEGAPSRGRTFSTFPLKSFLPALPLLAVVGYFFLFPISKLIYVSFLSNENTLTLGNFVTAFKDPYKTGFLNSIKIGLFF